jgi:hypothetical protein
MIAKVLVHRGEIAMDHLIPYVPARFELVKLNNITLDGGRAAGQVLGSDFRSVGHEFERSRLFCR